jgi:uncharacterized protein YkwD
MRDLKRGLLLLILLAALSATLALSNVGTTVAASAHLPPLQTPAVDITVEVAPFNVEPGQTAMVTVVIKNASPSPIAPEVSIFLPDSVSAKLNDLPSGTIYNAQSGALNWQPVMPGSGAELRLLLPVVAQVADPQAPEQTISVFARAGGQDIQQDATFWIGLAPSATVRMSPPQVAVGQPLQLLGTVNGPGPVSQLWSLGDGRIVEATDPTVVYPQPGTYEIVFQASTPMGVISQSVSVSVLAQTVARFGVSDSTPAVGSDVLFLNESGGQQPLSYLWDFGDGQISTEPQPVHRFQVPGTYDVHLFVTGALGQSESVKTVSVGTTPVADFIIADAVDAGTVVQGQAFTDESATKVIWDMGDGHTYEGPVMEHVYWAAGDYPVTVTVANEYGETRMMRLIQVNPGRLRLYLPLVLAHGDAETSPVEEPQAAVESTAEEQLQLSVNPPQEELPRLELPEGLTQQEMLLAYINEARRVNGLNALNLVPELSAAAQKHADDMATNGSTSHTGSDGSVPALRVLLSGYPGGYAGEAMAWGMADAIEPVRFWLTSPGHRPIILDPAARDVGVGFNENFTAPSVWYWTADFASMDLPVVRVPLPPSMTPVPEPVITLLGPPTDGEFKLSADTNLMFTWSWPRPLEDNQRFGLYLRSRGRTTQIGTVSAPQFDDQYHFTTSAGNVPALPGQQSWFVRLEDTFSGEMHEQSEFRTIQFVSEP